MDVEMVTENTGLIHKFARKWEWRTKNTAADYDDLFSEGCIGLIKAVKTFDPEKGFQFSSHACSQIEGQILNFLNRQLPLIHYPNEMRAMIKVIKSEELTVRQVMTRFKCSQQVARLAYDCAHTTVVSMNAERSVDGEVTGSLEDMISSIDDFSTAHVEEFKSTLSTDERTFVDLLARDLSIKEIAEEVDTKYNVILIKLRSIRARFRQYQAGLPYRGYRSGRMADSHKIGCR